MKQSDNWFGQIMTSRLDFIAQSGLGRLIARILGALGVSGRSTVIGIPFFWLFLFFLFPFAVVLRITFSESAVASPPYTSLFEWAEDAVLNIRLSFASYQFVMEDNLYLTAYLNSVRIAAISTVLCLLVGYPMAYGIARCSPSVRSSLLMLVILPFWTSFLLRVYAWVGILQNNGVINNFLLSIGVIHEPIQMLQTDFAVYVGIVYSYLPFMILPLYANLEKMDLTLLEAASDLGCRPWRSFLKITLPLSTSGIVAGCMLVFIPAVGEFVIPTLLGGPATTMIGRVLWDEFFSNRDWPVASTVAIAMLFLLVLPVMFFRGIQDKTLEGQKS